MNEAGLDMFYLGIESGSDIVLKKVTKGAVAKTIIKSVNKAKEAGYEIKVGKFPFSASGKAKAAGTPEGFVKVIPAAVGFSMGAIFIFGLDKVTVISQQFHNERAIYIAKQKGLDAIGFNAQDLSTTQGFKVQLREYFARVKVFIDVLFVGEGYW